MAKAFNMVVAACIWAPALFAADAPPCTDAQPAPVPAQAAPAPAQEQTSYQKADGEVIDFNQLRETAEAEEGTKVIRMTLEECIQMAIENNPALQVVKYEALKTGADILLEKGAFDPLLSGQITYNESVQAALAAREAKEPLYLRGLQTVSVGLQATNVLVQTAEQLANGTTAPIVNRQLVDQSTSSQSLEPEVKSRNLTDRVSVTGTLHTGTVYDASLSVNGGASPYGYSPWEWSGGLTLTLIQPLLRSRGCEVNTARIHMAENATLAAESQLRLAVMTLVSDVIKAYWDLVGAEENVAVRAQALVSAQRLLNMSRRRLEIGTAARKEVLESKAGLATRQSDIANAQWFARNAENTLKAFLNMREDGIFSPVHIAPVDRPAEEAFDADMFKNKEEQVVKSIELCLKNRPEMTVSDLAIKTSELECSRTANDLLPYLDVNGSLFQGRHGYEWQNVFGGMVRGKDHSVAVGLTASMPLGNRTARGVHQRAGFALKQTKQGLESTKQNLMLKVRLASDAVQATRILIETNHQATEWQEANVAAEEKGLLIGISTGYRVLQIQQDLTLAQKQEVDARIDHEKALVDLRYYEGTLLDSLGIAFSPPDADDPLTTQREDHPSAPHLK